MKRCGDPVTNPIIKRLCTESDKVSEAITLDPLVILINEVFLKIFQELTWLDIKNCLLVSKQWFEVLSKEDKRKTQYLLRRVESIQQLININLPKQLNIEGFKIAYQKNHVELDILKKELEESRKVVEKIKGESRNLEKIILNKKLLNLFVYHLNFRFKLEKDFSFLMKECLGMCGLEKVSFDFDKLPTLGGQISFILNNFAEEKHCEISLALLVVINHINSIPLSSIFEFIVLEKGFSFALDVIYICCTSGCFDKKNIRKEIVDFFINFHEERVGDLAEEREVHSNQIGAIIREIGGKELTDEFLRELCFQIPSAEFTKEISLTPGLWGMLCLLEKVKDSNTSYSDILCTFTWQSIHNPKGLMQFLLEPTEEFKNLPDLLANWLELNPENFFKAYYQESFEEIKMEEGDVKTIQNWMGICQVLLYKKNKEETYEKIQQMVNEKMKSIDYEWF